MWQNLWATTTEVTLNRPNIKPLMNIFKAKSLLYKAFQIIINCGQPFWLKKMSAYNTQKTNYIVEMFGFNIVGDKKASQDRFETLLFVLLPFKHTKLHFMEYGVLENFSVFTEWNTRLLFSEVFVNLWTS